jgi:DNA-binding NtrC family response regulator
MAILHIEDHEAMRDLIRVALTACGILVISADSIASATRAMVDRTDVVGVLVDVHLRDGSGVDFYHWIVEHYPSLAASVAFVTGGGPLADAAAATGRQVLEKPFELGDVVSLAVDWEVKHRDPTVVPRL